MSQNICFTSGAPPMTDLSSGYTSPTVHSLLAHPQRQAIACRCVLCKETVRWPFGSVGSSLRPRKSIMHFSLYMAHCMWGIPQSKLVSANRTAGNSSQSGVMSHTPHERRIPTNYDCVTVYIPQYNAWLIPNASAAGEVGLHYSDVIITAISSQITSLTIVYSIVYSDADQRKHQSSVSLAFVRGIDRWIPRTKGR